MRKIQVVTINPREKISSAALHSLKKIKKSVSVVAKVRGSLHKYPSKFYP